MEISREDLYQRVWKTPMRTLAREFGVSDVGLSKACRRHAVPTPPLGYWTQLQHGKAPKRPPLPAASHGDTVSISEENSAAQRLARAAVAPKPAEVHVQVAATTDNLAAFSKATFQVLSKAKPTSAGLVSSGGVAHFACVVSPALAERACRILDAIERKLTELGAQVVRGTDKKLLQLQFSGQGVIFTLTERYTRTEFIPESERKSLYPRKEYAYHLTGELKLAIEGYYEGRKSWADGARAKLEDKLPEVLAGLVAAADAMRRKQQEWDEQRRQWAEDSRIRQEREDRARRRAAFRDALATEAQGWQRHQAAMQYLEHLRAQLGDQQLPQESAEWLVLAVQAVSDLDPTARRVRLLHEGVKPDCSGPFGQRLVQDKPPTSGVHG